MASNGDTFVPIVSSSPPPIDFGSSEEEDEDEFGNFSATKVEEFESPSSGIKSKGEKNHFFPIDVPRDRDNTVTAFSLNSNLDSPIDLPGSKLSDPPLPSGNNIGSDSSDRTTTIPRDDQQSEPLSNGLPHRDPSVSSSDSLEFIHSGDRSLADGRSQDSDFGNDAKAVASGDHGNSEDVPFPQSNTDSKHSDSEGSGGDFGIANANAGKQPPEISRPDNVSFPEAGGESKEATDRDAINHTFPDEGEPSIDEIPVEQPVSPLGQPKPSPPPLDSSFAEEDDEFGDFGAFEQRFPSDISRRQVHPGDTSSKTFEQEKPAKDSSDDFGSFPSRTAEETGFEEGSLSSNVTSQKSIDAGNGVKLKPGDGDDDRPDDFAEFSAFRTNTVETLNASEETPDDSEFAAFGDFKSQGNEKSSDWASFGVPHENEPKDDNVGDFGDLRGAAKSDSGNFGYKNTAQAQSNSFGDFKSTTKAGDGFEDPGSLEEPDDDEGFGDFGSAAKPDDDSFGDFGSFKATDTALKDDNFSGNDEFASFESSKSSQKVGGSSNRVNGVFNGCFPDSSMSIIAGLSLSMQPLSGLIGSSDLGTGSKSSGLGGTVIGNSPNGLGVWSVLSDMENTKAMGYQWTKSDSKKKLLSSIGLDERNILASRLGGMPKFASDLGMLQPSKPGEVLLQPDLPQAQQDEMSLPSQESVPKVEFDWSGSGLTNPLDANKLNLDFFATEPKSPTPGSKTKSKTAPSIDPDILDLASPANSGPSLAQPKPTPKPLEEIMRNSSTSMVHQRPTKREAGLSGEANRVLDGLPDLSYMLAKVLMFPIRSPAQPLSGATDSGLGGGLLD